MTFEIFRLPEHLIEASNRTWWVCEGRISGRDGSDFHGERWHYIQNQAAIAIRSAKDHSQETIDGIVAGAKASRDTAYSLAEELCKPEGRSAFVSNRGPHYIGGNATFDKLVAEGKIVGWEG